MQITERDAIKLYHDKEWLYQKYWGEGLDCLQMAEIADCHPITIFRWMKSHGIPSRDSRATQLARSTNRLYRKKPWLEQKYIEEGLSLAQIAQLAGSHAETIRQWLKRYQIPIRDYAEVTTARWDRGEFDTEEAKRKHADALKQVWRTEERRRKRPWRGGKSFELYPPEFNNALKRIIRKRDCYCCAICGKKGRCVHHIDGDKQNNDLTNLITLDNSCHAKVHHDMDRWEPILAPMAIARTKGDKHYDSGH